MVFGFAKKLTDEDHIDIEENNENNEETEDFMNPYMLYSKELILEDCGITDITIFNNLNIGLLNLSNNNITSIENFENKNIYNLNLSNNKIGDINLSKLLSENTSELYLKNNNIKNISIDKNNKYEMIDTIDLSDNDITDISSLNNFDTISILSLANNINLNKFDIKDTEIYFINLSNTGVDDSLIEQINYEKIGTINLSSNKNITNYDKMIEDANNKIVKLNEELKNKFISENEIDMSYYENEHYSSDNYVDTSFIVTDHTFKSIPNAKLFTIYSNYELTLDKDTTGTINLVSPKNIELFRFFQNNNYRYDLTLKNLEFDKSETKLKVLGENAEIIMKDCFDSDLSYTIKIK